MRVEICCPVEARYCAHIPDDIHQMKRKMQDSLPLPRSLHFVAHRALVVIPMAILIVPRHCGGSVWKGARRLQVGHAGELESQGTSQSQAGMIKNVQRRGWWLLSSSRGRCLIATVLSSHPYACCPVIFFTHFDAISFLL